MSHCPNCGLPLATREMEGDEPGYCFFESSGRDRDFELDCLRLAVKRLRDAQEAKAQRAQFAGQALQGLLTYRPFLNCAKEPQLTAILAVAAADALLAELGAQNAEGGSHG